MHRTKEDSENELDVRRSSIRFEEEKKASLVEISSVEGSKAVTKKRKLRKLVTSNRHSLAKMPEAQQLKTCAICIDEVTEAAQAELDSCKHTFCFVCINQWVQSENACPLCKREIT